MTKKKPAAKRRPARKPDADAIAARQRRLVLDASIALLAQSSLEAADIAPTLVSVAAAVQRILRGTLPAAEAAMALHMDSAANAPASLVTN